MSDSGSIQIPEICLQRPLEKNHTETLEEDSFMHGQVADGVNGASFYWLPLENMILGLFTQPNSHYDSDTT